MKLTMFSSSCSGVMISVGVLLLFPVVFEAAAAAAQTAHEGAAVNNNMILPACKTVGGGSTYFDVTFCVDALGSVGEGADARNYQELAAVAAGLLTANATSTEAKIAGLLREGGGAIGNPAAARCLRLCKALYGGIAGSGPGLAAAIKGGRLAEARAVLGKSAAAAKGCEAGFGKSNMASPLTAEGDDAFKLAQLAVALLQFA